MSIQQLGPYRIEQTLGRGGMGTVYAGFDVKTGKHAAVKVLSPALAGDGNFRERFGAEIESLKKLRHPHIVQLYGYGEQNGHLFYAMQLIEGSNLQDELQAGRRFSWREVAQIGIDICRALKHAHDCGVIHRDLKPANLLLDADGRVKLTDFGIAKLFGHTQFTADGGVLGTADYMSPEQAEGRPVSHRCDLYSLGSVLYALLAQRPPFWAKSLPEVVHMLRYSDPEPISRFCRDVPEEMEKLIAQLLEKDPQRRPPTAQLVARRLEAMQRALSLVSEDPEPSEETTQQSSDDGLGQPQDFIAMRPTVEMPDDQQPEPGAAGQHDHPPGSESEQHFTVVDEDSTRLARRLDATEQDTATNWLRRASVAAAVLAIILAIWYFSRPPSADDLYQRIQAAAQTEEEEQLAAVQDDMELFLQHYPKHPRRGQVESYLEELQSARAQRKLLRDARNRSAAKFLSPVEQAYAEAIQLAQFRPAASLIKLQALIDVYGGQDDAPPENQRCVKQAKWQLERLKKSLKKSSAEQLAAVQQQLQRAEKLRQSDSEAAGRILRGVVELYGEHPWAAPAVKRAREMLAGMDGLEQ